MTFCEEAIMAEQKANLGSAAAAAARGRLEAILAGFEPVPGSLIPALQAVQAELGYVPREAAEHIARRLKVYPSKVYGVLTFYAQFQLTPRGRHILRVCCGTACHVQGGEQVVEAVKQKLGIGPDGTTQDGKFTFQQVACLGCCGLAPVVMVDEQVHAKVTPESIGRIIDDVEQ